jgi:hypothetical protein
MINFIKINTIKGFEDVKDYYYCNSFGDIFSNSVGTMKILKERYLGGYLRVHLVLKNGKQKSYFVHRIIASAFHENPQNKPTVNHINHNRADNRMENLSWATMKEQMDDIRNEKMAKAHYKKVMIKNHDKVLIIPSATHCAKFLNVKLSVVSNAIEKGYKCRGYEVSYV